MKNIKIKEVEPVFPEPKLSLEEHVYIAIKKGNHTYKSINKHVSDERGCNTHGGSLSTALMRLQFRGIIKKVKCPTCDLSDVYEIVKKS